MSAGICGAKSFARKTSSPAMVSSRPIRPGGHCSRPTAIVYAEGFLGELDGKTANGLMRQSDKYRIEAVIDSTKAGFDAGLVLEGRMNGVPVCTGLDEALAAASAPPNAFIVGIAPSSGLLSAAHREVVLDALKRGMNVVSGLHEFLGDDPVLAAAGRLAGATITDIRKPPDKRDLHTYSGRILSVDCPRIAILGTDCAIGKRTTACLITQALNDAGIRAVMIATGQTGLIQGARYGIAMDAIPSQFCAGELEAAVVEAYEAERPDVIIIEGQGALSHPAFSTSASILRGCMPDGVVIQHAPHRQYRCDFPTMPMPSLVSEIKLIELFASTKVIGVTINHESMTEPELAAEIARIKRDLDLPVTDPLTRSADELVGMVGLAFPGIRQSASLVLE